MSSELLLYPPHQLESVDSFNWYRRQVEALPVLSADEEQALAIRYRDDEDLEAAQQLVLSQLRYVIRIAYQFQGYGLSIADLVQEGTVGLMKAVKRFDPNHGVRLVTFAVHWIKSEIHDYVIKNWRIVKVATTKAQRKLFFNLRSAKKRLGWCTPEEVAQVAEDLGVTPNEVREMESRLNAHDAVFDPEPIDGEEALQSPSAYLTGPSESDPAVALMQADLDQKAKSRLTYALAELDPRSYDIIDKRWLSEDKTPLKTLAANHALSIERVRQIETRALNQLKAAFAEEPI